jgi:transcriptional regulator with XRE-family HTH domain
MFKQRFTLLCAKKNTSPSVVCRAVGLTPSAYSQWKDDSVPRKTTIIKIADYLGVTVDDLVGNDDVCNATEPEEEKRPAADLNQQLAELWEQLDEAGKEEAKRYLEYLRSRRQSK